MAGFQVTVSNSGAPVTVGGVLFGTGDTVVGAATLELMVDLGLVNAIRTPFFAYDMAEIEGFAAASMVLTMAAAGHVVSP